jgi:hypothetical protein
MMANVRALARAGLGLAAVSLGLGCTAEGSIQTIPGPGGAVVPVPTEQRSGQVTIDFTVSGTRDPAICGAHAARELEVTVYDDAGRALATTYGACEGFSIVLELPEGRYQAQAQLVDEHRRAVSTTLPLQDLDVVAGTDLTVSADFPAGSFL